MTDKDKIVVRSENSENKIDLSRSTPKPSKKQSRAIEVKGTSAPRGGGEDVLEATVEVFGGLHRHNVEQARQLGAELAEAEQKIPLHVVEAYQQRKKELEEAGADARSFLSQLSRGAKEAGARTYSLGIEDIGIAAE
jgi:hypothetical protein